MGHVALSELPRALVAGAAATRHVAAPELSCARGWEPQDKRAYGGPGAAMGPGGGSCHHEARGGSGAALCQGMGVAGHAGMCAHIAFRL
jgi:hypothetical protein